MHSEANNPKRPQPVTYDQLKRGSAGNQQTKVLSRHPLKSKLYTKKPRKGQA